MLIKPLYDHNTYDIFLGEGWMNWVRVKTTTDELIVIDKAETVEITGKLTELIYFKIKRYRRQ